MKNLPESKNEHPVPHGEPFQGDHDISEDVLDHEAPESSTDDGTNQQMLNIRKMLLGGLAIALLCCAAVLFVVQQSSRQDTPHERGGKLWGNKKDVPDDTVPRSGSEGETPSPTDGTTLDLASLPAAPSIVQPTRTSYPMYFFLFTHTEDHINHELSEERYTRIGPMLEALQRKYPQEDLTWTIEFQGADAQTVAERDASTGIATYLKSLAADGLVEFGYHAHHDPTYLNRPQKSLTENSSWDAVYDAMTTWITCKKDPLKGGCIAETGGGLTAIQNNFGPVQIVTGLGGIAMDGANIERSAGSEAVRALVPDRMLSFGFPDHGMTIKDTGYAEARDALMELLTPTAETTSTVFWMDNSVSINDGIPHEGMSSLTLRDGSTATQSALASISNDQVNIINTGIVDKFIYAKQGQSPTQYAYSHPTNPELPPSMLLSDAERDRYYANTQASLEYILGSYLPTHAGGFLRSDAVVAAVTSDDFWNVDAQELSAISAWLVHNWETRPPVYTTDGSDFYSLADTFALLWNGLQGKHDTRALISSWYGPWAAETTSTKATSISAQDLQALVRSGASGRSIPATFTVAGSTYTAAQILYAMAYEYLLESDPSLAGKWTHIAIPELSPMPESFDYLEDIGCMGCTDTTWSLKPARFHE